MESNPVVRNLNRLIKYSFFLLFSLVPLLLTKWNSELFEYNKMMATYALTAVIATSWGIKSIIKKEIRIAKTPLDIPIWLFLASQLISSIFSIDPHISWFGYYSRFNGGMWSLISYITLYYALVSNTDMFVDAQATQGKKPKVVPIISLLPNILPLLIASLITAALVAFYGVLERMGIDKDIWVQDVQNRVFSTLGQPNWLAAYLVALSPLALGLTWLSQKTSRWWMRYVWGATSILLFVTLLFTRSKSGILAFVIADAILCAFLFARVWRTTVTKKALALRIGALHAILAGIVLINGTGTPSIDRYVTIAGLSDMARHVTSPAPKATTPEGYTPPALEFGGTDSGTIRKYVWQGAISAWKSTTKTLAIGTGTETFAFAFYQHRPVEHNQTSEWDFLYNKAHNEYLNFLATTGAIGLGTYLLFIAIFIMWFIRKIQNLWKLDNTELFTISVALFAGWVSLLVTNFFGFSVVIGQLFLFLFPALCILMLSTEYPLSARIKKLDGVQPKTITALFWITLCVGSLGLIKIAMYWYADTLYAQGYRYSRAGQADTAVNLISHAIRYNPSEPLYHDELSGNYAVLAAEAFGGKNATEAAELSQNAIKESDRALKQSPQNVNFWKTRTKVFYTLSALDPTMNDSAIEALKQAQKLSPNDPKIDYNLAILTGRMGDLDQAVAYLLEAKRLKKDYRDVYYALYVFYTELRKPNDARAILQDYLTNVDPNDQDFQQRITQ
jgi:hypothetical protein